MSRDKAERTERQSIQSVPHSSFSTAEADLWLEAARLFIDAEMFSEALSCVMEAKATGSFTVRRDTDLERQRHMEEE